MTLIFIAVHSVVYVPHRAGFQVPDECVDTDSLIDVHASPSFAARFVFLFGDAVRIEHVPPESLDQIKSSARLLTFNTWTSVNGTELCRHKG